MKSQRGFLLNPFRFGGGGGGGPGHRYWRAVNFLVDGSFLEISELRLYESGSAIDGSVTLTASDAVDGGSLSNLNDTVLSTRAYWVAATAEAGGFYIEWDFGTNASPDALRIGGFDTTDRYPTDVDIEYSDDGSSWTLQQSFTGLTYPGNNTLSGSLTL
jgi:hypothetical protein